MPTENIFGSPIDMGIGCPILDPKPKQSRIGRWVEAGMGKRDESKVAVREWIDACAPDEIRDALIELIGAARNVRNVEWGPGETDQAHIVRLDAALLACSEAM